MNPHPPLTKKKYLLECLVFRILFEPHFHGSSPIQGSKESMKEAYGNLFLHVSSFSARWCTENIF